MTCFGVIVSPARAYTLPTAPGAAGMLHLTQVSLDDGSDDRTVTVRVTLGEKVPIIIARLLPRHSESLHLDLRYNLSQEVTFSVIGPRKVHLAGYFDGLPDSADSESFGEDIAQSDSYQKSGGDSDYGGSFINDSDPGYSSPSADSSSKANGHPDDQEMFPEEKKGSRRRLRKVLVVESDSDSSGSSGGGGSGSVSVVPDSDDDFEFFRDSLLKRKSRELPLGEGAVQMTVSPTQKLTRSSVRGIEMAEKSVLPVSNGSSAISLSKQSAKMKDSNEGSTNVISRTPLKNESNGGAIRSIVVENDLEVGNAASPRPMKTGTVYESSSKKKKKCFKILDLNCNTDNEQSLEAVNPEPVILLSPKNSGVDFGLNMTKKKKKKKKQVKDELGGTAEPTKEQASRVPNALVKEKQLAGMKCLEAVKPVPVALHSPKKSVDVDLGLKVSKKKQLKNVLCGAGVSLSKGKRKMDEENVAEVNPPCVPLTTPTPPMPSKAEDESKVEKKNKKKHRET